MAENEETRPLVIHHHHYHVTAENVELPEGQHQLQVAGNVNVHGDLHHVDQQHVMVGDLHHHHDATPTQAAPPAPTGRQQQDRVVAAVARDQQQLPTRGNQQETDVQSDQLHVQAQPSLRNRQPETSGVGTEPQKINLRDKVEVESSSREQSSSAAINQSPMAAGSSQRKTNSKQLVSKDKKKLLCIVGGYSTKKELKLVDILTTKCKNVNLPFEHVSACAVEVGAKIRCFGGEGSPATGQAHAITTTPFEVNKIRNMNVTRTWAGAAVLDGRVYVSGGRRGDRFSDPLSSCSVYSIADDTWSQIPDMITDRHGHAAVSWNGQIVVIGGWGGGSDQRLTSVEYFDPHTREWRKLAPLNVGRRSLAAVVIGDFIYAIGGFDEKNTLKTVEKYSNGRWQTVAPMNLARRRHAACVVDGRIFAVGGTGDGGSLTSVETYDPTEDKWTKFCELDKKYVDHSVVAL